MNNLPQFFPNHARGDSRRPGVGAELGAHVTSVRRGQDFEDLRARRTIVRPGGGIVPTKRLWDLSGTYILSATPNTNYSTATILTTSSDVLDVYGSTGKVIVKIDTPIQVANDLGLFLCLPRIDGSAFVQLDGSPSSSPTFDNIQLQFQSTYIMADFDIATLTWNNYGSLTLGNKMDTAVIRGGNSTDGNEDDFRVDLDSDGPNAAGGLMLKGKGVNINAPVFGFSVEVLASVPGSGGLGILSLSILAQIFTLGVRPGFAINYP